MVASLGEPRLHRVPPATTQGRNLHAPEAFANEFCRPLMCAGLVVATIHGKNVRLCQHWSMGDLLGYARVSTTDQDPALQHDALEKAGCVRIFTDIASGSLAARPELDKLLDHLRKGDTLVVWRLDRLGRNLRHLLELVEQLGQRDVGFRSLTESIDTTTPGGRLVFSIFGALAEFERGIIVERTHAGLAAARSRGRVGGRPTVLTPEKRSAASAMWSTGESVAAIAMALGVSERTVRRFLAEEVATGQSRLRVGSQPSG